MAQRGKEARQPLAAPTRGYGREQVPGGGDMAGGSGAEPGDGLIKQLLLKQRSKGDDDDAEYMYRQSSWN